MPGYPQASQTTVLTAMHALVTMMHMRTIFAFVAR